jgi:nitric oxide synthase oxygenase domain/subunit
MQTILAKKEENEMYMYKVKGGSILKHTTAASKFTRRSSSEKSAFPNGM